MTEQFSLFSFGLLAINVILCILNIVFRNNKGIWFHSTLGWTLAGMWYLVAHGVIE